MKPPLRIFATTAFLITALSGTSLSTAPATKELGSSPTQIAGLFYYLPEGRIHAVGTPGKEPTDPYTITITPDIGPDVQAAYFIKRDSNYVYDDVIDLKADANGLLTTGSVTSTDETANIIASVISMIPAATAHGEPPPPTSLKAFDVIFYPKGARAPGDSLSFDSAQNRLAGCGFRLDSPVTVSKESDSGNPMEKPAKTTRIIPSDFKDGVAFRLAKAYPISIVSLPTYVPATQAGRAVLIPDKNETYYLDYSRMPFVAKKTNIGFTNGMLTEFNQETPSPIAGFLGIPKSIIQAVIPIPGTSTSTSGSGAGKSTSTGKS